MAKGGSKISSRYRLSVLTGCVLLSIHLFLGIGKAEDVDRSMKGYGIPNVPPKAHYIIDCHIDPATKSLKGTEIIRLRNNSSRPIYQLALDWSLSNGQTVIITVNGRQISTLADSEQTDLISPILFELPVELPPGEQVELNLRFNQPFPPQRYGDKIRLTKWHPRLWWGFPTHDDFDVKIQVPRDYTVATSGRFDPESGYYHAEGVRSFGLFLGNNLQVMESNTGGVLVRCLFTPKGEECARLLLETALDVIDFYRKRFGFYPHRNLTIVPWQDSPAGGYPMATALVAIHGQERMSERPEIHWRWITAHEIGHQYWGEYVMEKDSPGWGWLVIGLGIWSDREYIRARGLGLAKHRAVMARYIKGVRKFLNTTVDRPPDQIAEVDFDFNNVVIHGKGYSIISALACLVGDETFDRICRRCLEDLAGRPLNTNEFQVVCEGESGQELGWFFDQWVRSNRYLSYQVTSQRCIKKNDRYVSEVQVECGGTLKMPIPVRAHFEDGTNQQQFTDRLLEVNLLRFESAAPLKEVRLDPDGELALVVPPPSIEALELSKEIDQIPLTGAGKQTLGLFTKAQKVNLADALLWGKLGLTLYDGKYYLEALEAFRHSAELLEREGSEWSFVPLVWQGHILDLLDNREEAIQCYREALRGDTGLTYSYKQWGMKINRKWIDKRLKEPFKRR